MSGSNLTAEQVGRLWFERMWDRRELQMVRELMAENAIAHLEGGEEVVGPGAFERFQEEFLEAIPDIQLQVHKLLADETNVCVHWSASGTHTGNGFGCHPSNCRLEFQGTTWLRVEAGMIVEGWDFWNKDRLMRIISAGNPPI